MDYKLQSSSSSCATQGCVFQQQWLVVANQIQQLTCCNLFPYVMYCVQVLRHRTQMFYDADSSLVIANPALQLTCHMFTFLCRLLRAGAAQQDADSLRRRHKPRHRQPSTATDVPSLAPYVICHMQVLRRRTQILTSLTSAIVANLLLQPTCYNLHPMSFVTCRCCATGRRFCTSLTSASLSPTSHCN